MMSDLMLRISATGLDTLQVSIAKVSFELRQHMFMALSHELEQAQLSWLRDIVICEYSVTVQYDCTCISYVEVKRFIKEVTHDLQADNNASTEDGILELPADYSLSAGLDLEELSFWCNLSISEIIKLHSNQVYQVTTIGFAPGFAYMKGLDKRLEVMRKDIPRTEVPAGAIAIANQYTAVYPQSSPGGWWLIGHCSANLFDPNRSPPCPLNVGQKVRFVPSNSNTISVSDNDGS